MCHGEPLVDSFKEIWQNKTSGLKAVGINCTPGKFIEPLLRSLEGLDVPVVIYPNREENGEEQHLDTFAKKWVAVHPNVFALGGCCFFHPSDVENLRNYLVLNCA